MPFNKEVKCADCVHLVPQTQVCMEYKASVEVEETRNCYFFTAGKYAHPTSETKPVKKGRKQKKLPSVFQEGQPALRG
jgi:hypothetical protein